MGVWLDPKIVIFEKSDFFGLWPASSEVKKTHPRPKGRCVSIDNDYKKFRNCRNSQVLVRTSYNREYGLYISNISYKGGGRVYIFSII